MIQPTLSQLKQHMRPEHRFFPVACQLEMDQSDWFSLYRKLSRLSAFHFILESGRSGRYSMMGYRPAHRLQATNGHLHIWSFNEHGDVTGHTESKGSILSTVQDWMSMRRAPSFGHLPDFCGGWVGYLSYDLVREIEKIPVLSTDDLHIPDLDGLIYEQVIVYDHAQKTYWATMYVLIGDQDIGEQYEQARIKLRCWTEEIKTLLHTDDQIEAPHNRKQPVPNDMMKPSFSEAEFIQAVRRIQHYIAAGDVFQVNLSVRQSRQLNVPPLEVYAALREINPSPYMGYLHFPERQIVCASPEQLIKLKGDHLNTRPIAGTRPRGQTQAENTRLARELILNEKERAEHIMLVDLERNDLGKVSQYGTVRVDELMAIEEYSHVMHIVSNVQGQLSTGKNAFDVIKAVFPGGTITGAPKIRTMEIIEELEPVRRGLYTGSIGWIDYNGDMELNIVIRTMLAQSGWAHVQAGAGIVMDSVAHQEYEESLNKAKALWKAYELSQYRSVESGCS